MRQTDPDGHGTGSLMSVAGSILSGFELADGSPALGDLSVPGRDIFAETKRRAWDKSTEARCNFEMRPRITHRAGVWFLSLWQKSLMGRTLTEIKSDPAEILHFAEAVSDFLSQVLGKSLRTVTTGSTLKGMHDLLQPLNKNLLFITGINNKL